MAGEESRIDVLSKAYDSIGESQEPIGAAPEAPATEAPAPPAPEPKSDRARDESGRFAKSEEKKEPAKAKGDGKVVEPPSAEAKEGGDASPLSASPPSEAVTEKPKDATTQKPPSSWKAHAREKWAAVPEEVRAEVMRREREISIALEKTAESRRFAEEMQKVVSPFEPMIRAQGGTPAQAVDMVLRAAYMLQSGSPQHKAQLVANMIRNNGVDIQMLDSLLAGQAPDPRGTQAVDPLSIAQQVERRLAERLQAQAEQAAANSARERMSAFAASHEFYDDVRLKMADILAARGSPRPSDKELEEAYDLACRIDPDIYVVIRQREEAKSAATKQEAIKKAQEASSSIRSQPTAGNSAAQPTDRLEVLRRRYDELNR